VADYAGETSYADFRKKIDSGASDAPGTTYNPATGVSLASKPAPVVSVSATPPAAAPAATTFPTNRAETTAAQRAAFYRQYIQQKYPDKDPNIAIGIANAEGLNVNGALGPSTVDIDKATGKPFSYGDFQMNVRNGLGVTAQQAGFDPLNPNQWQDVGKFAIDTMYGTGKGYNLAPWKGDRYAEAYLKSGNAPATAVGAGATPAHVGGIGSDAVAGGVAGAPAPATASDVLASLNKSNAGQPSTMDDLAKMGEQQKTQATQQDQQAGNQLQQQMAMSAAMGRPQQNPAYQQLFAQMLAKGAQPLAWGAAPYGSGAGQQAPQTPGMTLNSTGGLYG
jgi:hypothetical protein